MRKIQLKEENLLDTPLITKKFNNFLPILNVTPTQAPKSEIKEEIVNQKRKRLSLDLITLQNYSFIWAIGKQEMTSDVEHLQRDLSFTKARMKEAFDYFQYERKYMR